VKQSAYLQWCRDEIKRSKRWRSQEGYEEEWKRYIDLYKGKQYNSNTAGDKLIVNLVFSTINVMAPAVAVNNPRFVVNARQPDKAPQAIVTEEILNYMWRTYRYQDEFRLSINDWLIVGHGWVKCGYKFTKPPEEKATGVETGASPDDNAADVGIDDRDDIDGNVESEMYVYDDRPFLERISVFDMFVDPDSRHTKEMCWIAQRIWRPVQDVNVDERYSPAARKKVSAKSWSRWSSSEGDQDARDDKPDKGSKSFCEIIEFYDIKRRQVSTFSLDAETTTERSSFLIKPKPMPYAMGQPFVMLRNYEVADHFYPLGDVCQIESLQLELNQTRTQMMNHRKRFQRKWLYNRDAFDRDGLSALESDIDNTMIPVLADDLSQVIIPLPAVITPSEFYDQSSLITQDIDRVSGVSDYQRGAGQTAVKRTATEAAMIQDAANARAQDRLAKVESVLAQLGERIIGLMQQYLTGDQVARIVTMPGRAWINYDADYIQGEFDYEVAAGSTEPQNETFRRQSALQLVDSSMPFLQMGVANPVTLYMQILQKGFGVKDASPFINPQALQQQQQEGGPAAPDQQLPTPDGQMPPQQDQGQAPPPDQGQMPPQMPPGMDPSMVQQGAPMPPGQMQGPPGAPPPASNGEIPPEMLMALLGSNGALPS
jgi:hypothetical protein